MTLPILDVLDALKTALADGPNAVLIAPPGAGKTTMVAPALLTEDWCNGQILLLSPRRLAARAAAERIAELSGEPVGKTIGYTTRMDSRISTETHVIVMTAGVFRNRIQADPELSGVSAVLFDEIHERSLDSDFGLALALDAQAGFRPDLRLLAMSATLDGEQFATLMDSAPIIESAGKAYPLELRHISRRADARIEDEMASAIRRALSENEGDCLAFLPGVAEINRTAERLTGCGADMHLLYGTLDPVQQRAAITKSANRKVILATSIAETSLTIDGVRIVVDSGLARRARYDRLAGSTRLVTERVSRAAATQRAGRAARQGAGLAYRLWEEAATAGLIAYDPPEILEADLSALLLDCAIWGLADPRALRWLDPPPDAAIAEARTRLIDLDAIDADGRPTAHGRAIAALPLPPRLAHMLVKAAEYGLAPLAADMAVLLTEHGLGGQDVDLEQRRERWHRERGQRADAARGMAKRWASIISPSPSGEGLGWGLSSATMIDSNSPAPTAPPPTPPLKGRGLEMSPGCIIALAFPDRIAKRRDASGEQWISAGGRGFRLDPAHPLARQDWLAVADIQGSAQGARIVAAAAVTIAEIEALFGDRIISGTHVSFDPATGGVRVETGRRLGAIALTKEQDGRASPEEIAAALLEGVRTHGVNLLTMADTTHHLRTRAAFAGMDVLSDVALINNLDSWLPPLLKGKRRLSEIDMGALQQALLDLLGWDETQRLNKVAPAYFAAPSGGTHYIDYDAAAGPTVTLRVQALFGLDQHPTIGPDRTPLVLSLTSPAGRPIQTTRDLPAFWRGSWADVAKEMRGRYPRHNWPDAPWDAIASLKTKNALARAR